MDQSITMIKIIGTLALLCKRIYILVILYIPLDFLELAFYYFFVVDNVMVIIASIYSLFQIALS
jgi:uncharacterized membrane protein YvlD (DUF360 family)